MQILALYKQNSDNLKFLSFQLILRHMCDSYHLNKICKVQFRSSQLKSTCQIHFNYYHILLHIVHLLFCIQVYKETPKID